MKREDEYPITSPPSATDSIGRIKYVNEEAVEVLFTEALFKWIALLRAKNKEEAAKWETVLNGLQLGWPEAVKQIEERILDGRRRND